MPAEREVRADFDRDTVTIYQVYPPAVADAALAAGRFVPPFSFHRMTWIKPSFLWLMHRSNWGLKSGQERVLAVRVRRTGWEKALARAVHTTFVPGGVRHAGGVGGRVRGRPGSPAMGRDPERTLRGAGLPHGSIQIGLSRHVIREYVEEWVERIEDVTPRARKMYDHLQAGRAEKAKRLLPPERVYPVGADLARRLLIG